ncbi:MAG: O-antigen ligase family protein, partial [Pseudomonadales bacterium]|nr:O-antigen ligase family protein [Pseudomonadales bacterium]
MRREAVLAAPRAIAALALLAAATLVAGLYNGPQHEVPLLFWSALALVAWSWFEPLRPRARHAAPAALLWIVWCMVSWRASTSPSLSLAPTWSLLLLPVALLGADASRHPRALLATAAGCGAVLVALSLPELIWGPRPRPRALLDPNNVATLTNMLWPLAVVALCSANSGPLQRGVGLLATSGAAALVLVSSGSRAGLALALFQLAFLAWGLGRAEAGRALLPLCAGVLLGALLAAGLVAGAAAQALSFDAEIAGRESSGLALRLHMARAGLELWSTAPLTGTGPQTFHLLYGALRSPADPYTAGVYVHNDWVQLLQELGLPALIALFVAFSWLSARGVRCLRGLQRARSTDRGERLEELALLLAVGATFVHAAVNFTFYVAPISLLTGLMLGRLGALGATAAGNGTRARRLPILGRVLATLMLFPLAVDAVSAAALMGQSGMPGLTATTQPRPGFARTLLALAPDDSVPALYLARFEQERAAAAPDADARRYALATAVQYYELALARDARNTSVHVAYAELLAAFGGRLSLPGVGERRAGDLLRAAYAMAPLDPQVVVALAG